MRVFRSTYRTNEGEVRSTPRWYVEVAVFGKVRRVAAFSDKAATTTLGRNVERLAQHVEAGGSVPADLARWADGLADRFRRKLSAWGLLDPRRAASGAQLEELLPLWHAAILDRGKTEQHARLSLQRAVMVLDGIGATRWADIGAERVEQFLAARRRDGLSARSSNHMLGAARAFCRWMVKTGRAAADPLAQVERVNHDTDRRRIARLLTHGEGRRLIRAAQTGKPVDGISGPTRALVWAVALETGVRATELAALRVGDFDFYTQTVTIRAASSKSRKAATVPLRESLCAALREHFGTRPATASAFDLGPGWRSYRLLRADRKRAGIPRLDEHGHELNYKSLRVSFISWLTEAGVPFKAVQSLARHSSAEMTLGLYARARREDEVRAVEGLPDLRPRNSASSSADAASGHVRQGSPDPASRGQGWRRHPDLNRGSRICNPSPGEAGAVDLSGVTSFGVADSASYSADELGQIRALVELVTPPGLLGAMEWAAEMQEVNRA